MKTITASLFNMFHICKREMWLHSNNINMEHTSDTVYEGKLIGENTYLQRPEKYTELQLDGIKIDFYDAKNKVIHETKKSNKVEHAHIAQVNYYQYVLSKNGLEGVTGVLEYPTLRKTETIMALSDIEKIEIENQVEEIKKIIHSDACPGKLKKTFCRSCSYFDFCWSEE